jgi:hypothetical protein
VLLGLLQALQETADLCREFDLDLGIVAHGLPQAVDEIDEFLGGELVGRFGRFDAGRFIPDLSLGDQVKRRIRLPVIQEVENVLPRGGIQVADGPPRGGDDEPCKVAPD